MVEDSMKRIVFILATLALWIPALAQESLSTVSGNVISGSSERQVLNALYGRLPGLQLYQNGSGYLPSSLTPIATVRGTGSYSGTHTLFIVDGVERDPSEIEVGEVESVTVLKDAASLLIWGIRGADGAVVITTRRGGTDPFRLKTQLRTGVQVPYGIPTMASPSAYAEAVNEARALDGLTPYYSASNVASLSGGTSNIIPTTDWESLMLRKYGFATDVNMSIDGSTRSTKYFVYANYSSNRGFLRNTGLTDNIDTQAAYYSLKLRSNLDVKITRYTDLVINLSARLQQEQGPQGGLDISSMYTAPTAGIPARLDNMWVRTNLIDNPVGSVLGTGNRIMFGRSLIGDIAIKQDLSMLIKGLKAEVRVSYDNASIVCDRKNFTYSYYTISPLYDAEGNIDDYALATYGNDTEIAFATWLQSQYMRLTGWAKLGWDGQFGKNRISAGLLASRDMYKLTGAGNMFKHQDYVFSLKYDFDGKYILDAGLNYSGSSLLSTGDKFRLYPAASLGWVVSREDFMQGASGVVDHLKIKASAGLSGMDANLVYDMDKQFNGAGNSYMFTFGSTQNGDREGDLPSVGVRPETDFKTDAGIEFHMPVGISGEVGAFYNRRTGLRTLAGNTTSGVLGIGLSDSFTGIVSNWGIEGALEYTGKIGEVQLNVGGTLSFTRNRIEHLEEEYHPFDYQYEAGGSVGRIFGLMSDGFYEASDFNPDGSLKDGVTSSSFAATLKPGDIKYKDLNNDGTIDNYDYTWLNIPSTPELYYGLHLGLSWKGISFSALIQGTGDRTVLTELPSIYQPLYGQDKNVSRYYLDNCWHQGVSDEGARYPRLTTLENGNNFLRSDVWTANGKYLKLREIQLSYSLPTSLISRIKLKEATVFFKGNNILSFDNIKILDPEYIALAYPRSRSFLFGINLQF